MISKDFTYVQVLVSRKFKHTLSELADLKSISLSKLCSELIMEALEQRISNKEVLTCVKEARDALLEALDAVDGLEKQNAFTPYRVEA